MSYWLSTDEIIILPAATWQKSLVAKGVRSIFHQTWFYFLNVLIFSSSIRWYQRKAEIPIKKWKKMAKKNLFITVLLYGRNNKNLIFSKWSKVDLTPFATKLFIYMCYLKSCYRCIDALRILCNEYIIQFRQA